MNSYSGDRSSSSRPTTTTSFDSYQFDFDINASRSSSGGSRPLRPGAATNASSQRPGATAAWTHQPASSAKPAWTHQPSPAAAKTPALGSGPTSMAGDIFGNSWSSVAPSFGIGKPQDNWLYY
jgi:hypothetical protein